MVMRHDDARRKANIIANIERDRENRRRAERVERVADKYNAQEPKSVPLIMDLHKGTGHGGKNAFRTGEYAAKGKLTKRDRQRIRRAQYRRLREIETVLNALESNRELMDMLSAKSK